MSPIQFEKIAILYLTAIQKSLKSGSILRIAALAQKTSPTDQVFESGGSAVIKAVNTFGKHLLPIAQQTDVAVSGATLANKQTFETIH